MCLSTLSRNRFLRKHRPGDDKVYWDITLHRWVSFNIASVVSDIRIDPSSGLMKMKSRLYLAGGLADQPRYHKDKSGEMIGAKTREELEDE